jgi:hypothetical protein
VNFEKESSSKEDKNICSSRQHFLYTEIREIKNGESFYFRYRFQNDYQVEWLFVSNRIKPVSYKKLT